MHACLFAALRVTMEPTPRPDPTPLYMICAPAVQTSAEQRRDTRTTECCIDRGSYDLAGRLRSRATGTKGAAKQGSTPVHGGCAALGGAPGWPDSAATQSSARRHAARRSHCRSRSPRPRPRPRAPGPPSRTTCTLRRPWRGRRKECAAARRGPTMAHGGGAGAPPILRAFARSRCSLRGACSLSRAPGLVVAPAVSFPRVLLRCVLVLRSCAVTIYKGGGETREGHPRRHCREPVMGQQGSPPECTRILKLYNKTNIWINKSMK